MKEQSKVKSDNENSISYQEAVSELEEILSEIETGEADVDVLSEKVKRALFLISYCRAKLKHTDDEVRKLIAGFDKPDQSENKKS
jgi:exodeoxyribonuclease VII small subunit